LLRQAFAHCARFPTAASRRSLGRVSVPVWLIVLSDQLPVVALVSRYLTNKLIGRETLPKQNPFLNRPCDRRRASGISSPFGGLSRTSGQVSHVLLTRSPLGRLQCCHWLDLVRLACVKHAASVRPEPGSNSPSKIRASSQATTPIDRDASRRAESLDYEALAPSDGANTIRILTVRFVSNDHAGAEAPRRSPALALSSCLLFSRSGLRSRHVPTWGGGAAGEPLQRPRLAVWGEGLI
jgi:hypothetical protein